MADIVPPPTPLDTEHALYRFFDTEGALLYVGISVHPFARMGQHQRDKSWWGEVATVTIERHPDRDAVLAAERDAIQAEKPRYNVVHSGMRRRVKPALVTTYDYWEPATGGPVTVHNVLPIAWTRLMLRCECGGHTSFKGVKITDHSDADFLVIGTCGECSRSVMRFVPKQDDRSPWLCEYQPYPKAV